jgi:hypothetical protein
VAQAEPLIRNISDTALLAAVYRAREAERQARSFAIPSRAVSPVSAAIRSPTPFPSATATPRVLSIRKNFCRVPIAGCSSAVQGISFNAKNRPSSQSPLSTGSMPMPANARLCGTRDHKFPTSLTLSTRPSYRRFFWPASGNCFRDSGSVRCTAARETDSSPGVHLPPSELKKTARRLKTSGTMTAAVAADERTPIIRLEWSAIAP